VLAPHPFSEPNRKDLDEAALRVAPASVRNASPGCYRPGPTTAQVWANNGAEPAAVLGGVADKYLSGIGVAGFQGKVVRPSQDKEFF
jgi:hypothetical protein